MRGVLDHDVEEELRRAFHHRVNLAEVIFVTAVEITVEKMLAEPAAAAGPHAGPGTIDGAGDAPEVGVVVKHPAAGAVEGLRSERAGHAEILEHRDERL